MSVATLKGLVRTWRTHPVTHGKLASAVARFLRWQIASRIHGGKLVFPFVEPTRLMAARGQTAATGNLYFGLLEFPEMAFLLHFLRPEDAFIDVGANTIISTTSANCIECTTGGRLNVTALKVQTTTSGFGMVSAGATINVGADINFGACASLYHAAAYNNGAINFNNNYTISGASPIHWYCEANGIIRAQAITITISGTPAFSAAFAYVTGTGVVLCAANTFSGSATGTRYSADTNGVISTQGGGATYLPGNSAGATASGGQYA